MKVLILGGSGLLGSKLVAAVGKLGHDVSYTFNEHRIKLGDFKGYKVDVSDVQSLIGAVKDVMPDVVIHTISLKGTDIYETNRDFADKINIDGTRNILEACKIAKPFIVYISSAFVFDGKKNIFTEDDNPNPINYYGESKFAVEKMVMSSNLPFMITRVDQLYGWTLSGQEGNTVTKNLRKLEMGENVEEISDWYNNPTLADNAAEVIAALINKSRNGIYHVVGSDFMNRVEWGIKTAEIFGFDKNLIKSKNSEKLNLPAKRPNANLSNKKAQIDGGVKLLSVDEGLKFMRKQINKDD
ncbi:MAG: SDR family oxidoreductase [Candidatus Aenigmarchaeota archaeon]|nr:SDR family oxidoreductase [Candidatus Aenigmarchaeota archaeon]